MSDGPWYWKCYCGAEFDWQHSKYCGRKDENREACGAVMWKVGELSIWTKQHLVPGYVHEVWLTSLPFRETICHVLKAFEGTGISSDHLAAQIESQVRSWIAYNAKDPQ